MSLRLSEPAAEPVTLAEAKAHTRADDADDALLAALITAGREYVESETARVLIERTGVLSLDRFPSVIRVPGAPLVSVEALRYLDIEGQQQTLPSDQYRVDASSAPGRITPAPGVAWPATLFVPGAVSIDLTVGYGTADDVPGVLKQALLLLVGHWYENREGVVIGTITSEVPIAVTSLLDKRRVYLGDS
ncbi:MAG: head-tail connector protein [Gammaproteobacteria bacterium]|nr:head-tail connector protein [Gammaproteobacteria bacterium]